MSVVTYIVETAKDYLDGAAETQFGAVASTVGEWFTLAATLVVILVLVNMTLQVRSVDARTSIILIFKITLIGIFTSNWAQFNYLYEAIMDVIERISGALVASVGGGEPGPSGTYSEEFDNLLAELGNYLNAVGDKLHWMTGALMDFGGVVALSILGGIAGFLIVSSYVIVALMVGIAPFAMFLMLFDVTKDWFARWLSASLSFAIYPIVIAGVFATIIGICRSLLEKLGDPNDAEGIGALVPFFIMLLMAKGFMIATPFIVRAISGNIVMPSVSAGLGGSAQFGRAAFGSRNAQQRYDQGRSSLPEAAGVRANRFIGHTYKSTSDRLRRMAARNDRLGK